MTEKELILGCVENDPKSQKKLYDQYSRQMYPICLRYCKDEASAADALQKGFIRIFQKVSLFRGEGSFEGWMRKIIVRSALDQIKRDKAAIYYELDHVNENEISYNMNMDFDDFNYQQLLSMLATLPQGYRLVFSMFVIDEMSHAEIAESLKISESTSRTQLLRARKTMQSLIKEGSYTYDTSHQ
jgi:RNA polymerase sigma-70 factor (ECF subfamily)